ncbi:MAG: F0F1 ATP synthase subunit B [Flavobacteriales bacterium]|nr:F0F1 ATP synthase subunit B [Flavobacteriales bacterium]
MDLVTPGFGLVFWTTLSFLILLLLLRKFAWKPILGAVNAREKSIEEALIEAKKAREEMANLKADNERILKEARAERDQMLKEARTIRDNMIEESKGSAKAEAEKIISSARETIENEKKAALHELRNTVGTLAIEVAEKVLRSELTNTDKSKELVDDYLKDISFN